MESTYKMLQPLMIEPYINMSLEELSIIYTNSGLNPCILACAYNKTYKMIIDLSKRFWNLNEDDIDSYFLEMLDFGLQSWDDCKGTRFSTYLYKLMYNKFREITQASNYEKRKVNNSTVELKDIQSKASTDVYNLWECGSYLDCLSEKERQYCRLVSIGYDNHSIKDIMCVSWMTLTNLRKSLRRKINPEDLIFD